MPENNLISQFEDKNIHDFLPAKMMHFTLKSIGMKLAKWKRKELEKDEKVEIEEFSYFWLTSILESQNVHLAKKFAEANSDYLLVLLAMGQLEFMVHQELVSRELRCWTYDPYGIFEAGRLELVNLDFLRCYLRFDGFGVMADGDLTSALSSISKFLEQ